AVLMQAARDKKNRIVSAGYVTGYRGSPLGSLDQQFDRAKDEITHWNVRFQPGLNEDSAATALWGTQQAELRGEGRYQGVFGLWYGKGPGVDRSGDVFRHANLAGTSPFGGVLVAMGDDHTGESSTTLHQSEYALVDAMMPILSPAGVQEILDFSALGWALSRYAGVWVGLKCVKDTVEVTEVVDGRFDKVNLIAGDQLPECDGSIRLTDLPIDQEERLHLEKLPAVKKFAKFNSLDRVGFQNKNAKIGIISAGKSWLDMTHALEILGINESNAFELGLSTYKIGMVWPIESESLIEWARGLRLIIVVEEKRKLIEGQVKEIFFNRPNRPTVIGGTDELGNNLFQSHYALEPIAVARVLGEKIFLETKSSQINKKIKSLMKIGSEGSNAPVPARIPYFCAGCPHNISTKIPEGSRAYAGIGCHYMAQWMDRETEGYTHMGGEGANWIGEAPFSNRSHVFQNIGDGTYNHSGLMSIRAAVGSGTNITYKILFNDAVAMTGGQGHDGDLKALDIIQELKSVGVKKVIGVYDEKEDLILQEFKELVDVYPRDELLGAQKTLASIKGVTALVYIQTCAAEKRRRRKRGKFIDPDMRIFINPEVCEGCGDCGVQSNCVAILPKETRLGRKRQIDQSSCNKDFSCIDGFCPSFVSIEGAILKKWVPSSESIPYIESPHVPSIQKTFNIVVTGVGGTGVVTIGALLAMAAHLEGKGVGVMEMAGLAQKGGAVHIHCRIAKNPTDISAIRVSYEEAHALIGGDLMVTAGEKTLSLLKRNLTKVICASMEANTGEFVLDRDFSLPTDTMKLAISAKVGSDYIDFFDSIAIAKTFLGDSVYANVLLLGAAWQKGLIPLSIDSIKRAIELNKASVEGNLHAFDLGRWMAVDPTLSMKKNGKVDKLVNDPESLSEIVANRIVRLKEYQNNQLAIKYKTLVAQAETLDKTLALAVAKGYFKLLTYKDEYEVARLHSRYLKEYLSKEFHKFPLIKFYFAPPLISRKNKSGKIKKKQFGPWFFIVLKVLAKAKGIRGTMFDLFSYTQERKNEIKLISQYESDMKKFLPFYNGSNCDLLKELASLPIEIKGFGHVKEQSIQEASQKRQKIIDSLEVSPVPHLHAAE
ncbi:MAG: indolepyruvate ferredoxin oxidoreductase family protein, partial [Paracoccaceae bacterium]|nr:indolepyruvate ferredoxin oxidoreductase family protein [Paracoccaceae bacterium]